MEWPWQAKAFPNELSLRSCKSLKLLWLYLLCFCVYKFSILEGFVGFFFSGACKLQLPAVWLLNHGPAHEGVLHQLIAPFLRQKPGVLQFLVLLQRHFGGSTMPTPFSFFFPSPTKLPVLSEPSAGQKQSPVHWKTKTLSVLSVLYVFHRSHSPGRRRRPRWPLGCWPVLAWRWRMSLSETANLAAKPQHQPRCTTVKSVLWESGAGMPNLPLADVLASLFSKKGKYESRSINLLQKEIAFSYRKKNNFILDL